MMRIALITLHTPTPNNFRGASALPYHLMAFRPKGVDVEVWSFNLNDCTSKQVEESETQLGVKIHTVKKPGWLRLISPAPIRLFLPKPILGYLSLSDNVYADITSYLNGANSALWIYGEDISRLADSFGRARSHHHPRLRGDVLPPCPGDEGRPHRGQIDIALCLDVSPLCVHGLALSDKKRHQISSCG